MARLIANPAELRERGFRALARSLGWVNAVRFVQQIESGHGDYTKTRHRFLPSWDAETLVSRASDLARALPRRRGRGRSPGRGSRQRLAQR